MPTPTSAQEAEIRKLVGKANLDAFNLAYPDELSAVFAGDVMATAQHIADTLCADARAAIAQQGNITSRSLGSASVSYGSGSNSAKAQSACDLAQQLRNKASGGVFGGPSFAPLWDES